MFEFSPSDGLRNASTYPAKPTSESAAREQIQGRLDEVKNYINKHGIVVNDSGTVNTLVVTLSPVPTIETDMLLFVKVKNTNTGACTININSLGAKAIVKNNGIPLIAGDLIINNYYIFVYNGTNWTLLNNYNIPTLNNLDLTGTSLVNNGAYCRSIYYKDSFRNTTVEFNLKISGTSNDIVHGKNITTLPAGYRPVNISEFPCLAIKSDYSIAPGFIRLHDAGYMYYYAYNSASCMYLIANFSYLAES
jgi:hypothetical protein